MLKQVKDFFPDPVILAKLRQLGWKFDIDSWKNKGGELQFALTYQSPRMKTPEITYLETVWEPSLRDEESWTVARRFMDENTMFRGLFQQKITDLFRRNKNVDPDSLEVEIEFKTGAKHAE